MNALIWIQNNFSILIWMVGFVFIIGKYKAEFDRHDRVLGKHEEAIDGILKRLDNMNSEVNFIKGTLYRN